MCALQAPTDPAGLRNLGNTCYVNAAMQFLHSLPDFRNALYKLEPELAEQDIVKQMRWEGWMDLHASCIQQGPAYQLRHLPTLQLSSYSSWVCGSSRGSYDKVKVLMPPWLDHMAAGHNMQHTAAMTTGQLWFVRQRALFVVFMVFDCPELQSQSHPDVYACIRVCASCCHLQGPVH